VSTGKAELGMKCGLAIFLGAALLLSCESGGGKDDLNTNYKEPMVWGVMSKTRDVDLTVSFNKDFQVFDYDGLRMVPVVTLNGEQVEAISYSATSYEYGDTNVIPTNHEYEFEVRHFWGTGFCHVVMPGDFGLTLPPDTLLLRPESTLVAAWRTSRGAQWYWLSIYANYDYYDTTGVWDNREFRLDTLMCDTAIAVPPERMFPPPVGQVISGDASVTVWSGYGPPVEPGDLGNVRGTATGFVNAINEPPTTYFYVGAPPAVRRAPESHSELERFKARLLGRMHIPGELPTSQP
jgi:hypothetical protein